MGSIVFIGSWVSFVFFILLLIALAVFLAKNGWLLGGRKMSFGGGITYSAIVGALFGIAVAILFVHNFEIR